MLLYLPVAGRQGLFNASPRLMWTLFAIAVLDAATRSIVAYRRGNTLPQALAWCYTFLDLTIISIGIALTRGLASDLWLLFFVILIFETLSAPAHQRRILDLSVVVAYTLAALPYQLAGQAPARSLGEFGRILSSRLFFLILVSSLARRISRQSLEADRELSRLREQMAASEERARIAREVHDGLGHAMVSAILRLELCRRLIGSNPTEAEALLREEIPALRAAWNEGRDLAFHLRPWDANVNTCAALADLLRRECGRLAERTGLIIDLRAEVDGSPVSPEIAFALTRIVQEALTNAVRHAHASNIDVQMAQTDGSLLRCTIRDNGAGFAIGEKALGIGLQAMRERAEGCGGAFTLESAHGKGAAITVSLPLGKARTASPSSPRPGSARRAPHPSE